MESLLTGRGPSLAPTKQLSETSTFGGKETSAADQDGAVSEMCAYSWAAMYCGNPASGILRTPVARTHHSGATRLHKHLQVFPTQKRRNEDDPPVEWLLVH